MTEQTPDKRKESIVAMKGAHRHLQDIFAKMDTMDSVMSDVLEDLRRDAAKVGELQIETYLEGKYQTVPLKKVLHHHALRLEKARI